MALMSISVIKVAVGNYLQRVMISEKLSCIRIQSPNHEYVTYFAVGRSKVDNAIKLCFSRWHMSMVAIAVT